MGRVTKVPITPEVLLWAIDESGLTPDDVASAASVAPNVLTAWLAGLDRPTLTQARALSGKLRRPLASFLLPRTPRIQPPPVQFRATPGVRRRDLNSDERLVLRDAVRIQRVVAWAESERATPPLRIPRHTVAADPESTANAIRRLLAVSEATQLEWRTPSKAFAGWRAALERIGIIVIAVPIGKDSCRGFSVWDEHAPMIVANTWWNSAARTFTLLHELGHLVTRTSSACVGQLVALRANQGDATERWCEEFAAAVLLPLGEVKRQLNETGWQPGEPISELRPISRVARKLNASLRATALRLIKAGLASPRLYGAIPTNTDHKRGGGGGGGGRPRYVARRDQLGTRTVKVFLDAVETGVLTTADVLSYMDVSYSELPALAKEVNSGPLGDAVLRQCRVSSR
ncbi:MAG: ImmA/IrrE family metallo-endopeptidase [Gemmatimonadota bacterium]